MGIAALIVPAVLIDALGGGNGYIAVSPALQKKTCLEQKLVNQRIDGAVVVEIGVGRFTVNFIYYLIERRTVIRGCKKLWASIRR